MNNFDIIRTITSTRAARIRPGIYGSQRRDYGFTVDIPDNLPIVGIIDTGVGSIEPLRAAITNISYDHTGMGQHWDESGHGTLVAGLVILGQEFLKNIKGSYTAKARVATLKVIHHNTDEIDIPRLLHDIRDAKNNYGIRLFNMSLNIPTVKQYNDAFSSFAFELDKLAHELGILLFLSVGNISEERLRELTEQEPHVSHEYPNLFYCLNSNSEIHSCHSTNIQEPAESLCNISVGALAGNLEGTTNHDLTPASEYPAYYTRKFHLDFTQPVNGTELKRNQINKYLNKPDIVFEGGDLFNYDAGIEILRSPLADTEKFFGRSCGTSIATPLVTSMAAELLGTYPDLTVQSVKALLINSSQSSCGPNPPAFQNYGINLLRKLSGFGRPTHDNLIFTDDNTITFIVEDTIKVDEFNTIPIKLPAYISDTDNKLSFTLSLCYSFLPVKDNHLNYLPLHISFGIFKPLQASEMADLNTERYRIKTGITWSDDFFGVENRLFSNTQKLSFNLLAKDVRALGNEVSLAIRCTAKTEIPELHRQDLVGSDHPFSIAITISEIPTNKANNTLFAQMMADNIVENIGESEGEATIEV